MSIKVQAANGQCVWCMWGYQDLFCHMPPNLQQSVSEKTLGITDDNENISIGVTMLSFEEIFKC